MVNARSVSPEIYTKKFYLTESGSFKKLLKDEIPQRFLYALKLADLKKGMRVLDVGAGRGEFAIECAKKGAYVRAIDYSQAAVQIAKENLKKLDKRTAKRLVFEKMNAKKIIYPDKFFDVVYMGDVVEHLYPEELKQVFLEIKRVLKPGGKLIIRTCPNAWFIRPLYFLAGIFFPWWKKHGMHVNEQNFFSLRKNLRLFQGRTRVFFRPEEKTFSGVIDGFKEAPFWAVCLAGLLDKLFDNKVISLLIYRTPLVLFLGVSLWAVVEIPAKTYNQEYFHAELRISKSPRLIHHGSVVIIRDILKSKKKILDLGCGIGVLSKYLADLGKEVWGVDGSRYAISWAKDKYQAKNLHFHLLDLEKDKLPFPDKFFNGVFSSHILEHLANLDWFFKEIKRVVADGGLVVFVVPNNGFGYRHFLMKILWQPLGRREDSTHKHSFAVSSLRKLVEQHFPSVEIFTYPALLIWLASPRLARLLSFGLGNNIFAVCRLKEKSLR